MSTTVWRIMFRDNKDGRRYARSYETEAKYLLWLDLLADKEYWDVEILSHGPRQVPLTPAERE